MTPEQATQCASYVLNGTIVPMIAYGFILGSVTFFAIWLGVKVTSWLSKL